MYPSAVRHVARKTNGTWRETGHNGSDLLFTYLLDQDKSRSIVHIVVADGGQKVVFAKRMGRSTWVETVPVEDEELRERAVMDRQNLLSVLQEMKKRRTGN